MKQIAVLTVTAISSLMFVSCQETEELSYSHPEPMNVGVTVELGQTRAVNHGTELAGGAKIGVFVTKTDGTSYDGQGYSNIAYTATGTGASQTWTAASPVLLSSTVGKAVAYYPHGTASDPAAIGVDANGEDYMYSGWVNGISNAAPNATFQMRHALTAIAITMKKGSYTGAGAVTAISIQSEGFGKAGTLNATTGALSAVTGAGEAVTWNGSYTMSTTGTTNEILVVPNGTAGKAMTVNAVIDGKNYSTSIAMDATAAYAQGTIYAYTLTLNGTQLSVTKVSVVPWNTTDKGNSEVKPA